MSDQWMTTSAQLETKKWHISHQLVTQLVPNYWPISNLSDQSVTLKMS